MKIGLVVALDILVNRLGNNTLSKYFTEHSIKKTELYITFGIRHKVEESITDEKQTAEWHKLIKEATQQRIVVKSLHKYKLKSEFKKLYHRLKPLNEKLTPIERNLIALSFQHGIDVDTDDSRLTRVINEVKTTPHLQKFAAKLLSHEKIS